MDLLKQALAPIPEEAWDEINDRAEEVILSQLTARKILHVNGPHGILKRNATTGRMGVINEAADQKVGSALYTDYPLVETRIKFDLDRWEMDNAARGAKDIELDNLEAAAEKLALYEEDAIYNGNDKAGIKGLKAIATHQLSLSGDANHDLGALAEGVLKLNDAYAEGPYDLAVGNDVFKFLNQMYQGGHLLKAVKKIIGGEVVRSQVLSGAVLVPRNHEDLEMTIGQDYSVGYDTHDDKTLTLFIMNAFTFRCLDEDIIVAYDFKKK